MLRDEVAKMPPLPIAIWITGALVVLILWAARSLATQRLINRAVPASHRTNALVNFSAARLGLKRVPETRLTADRVSPTVVCGLRPRLILPSELWESLDEPGRIAVITHELAHLRRLDHVWCWAIGLVALVYWWHPVAWWARKRLREEADASCDAWVTSVLPGARRAYAEALVTTKSYLSLPGRCALPGLGVMSGRAQKMARRIKMVMTQRTAPRASVLGALAAVSIATLGMFVMPALACPPDEKESKTKVSQTAAADKAEAEAKQRQAQAKAKEKAAKQRAQARGAAPRAEGDFFGEAPALEAMRRGQNREDAARELEAKARKLEEQARQLERQRGPRAEREQRCAPARVSVIGSGGPTEIRIYELPGGRLEALTELMARGDVPILIERRDGAIAVHGTPGQHRAFRDFVILIAPETAKGRAHGEHEHSLQWDRQRAEEMAVEIREKVHRELERRQQGLERLQQRMERERQRQQQRSHSFEEKADRMREKAQRFAESRAGALDPEEIERAVAQMEAEAEALALAAEEAESFSELTEERFEGARERWEELAEIIREQVEERMESFQEQFEDAAEEAEENEDFEFEFNFDDLDAERFMEQLRPMLDRFNQEMDAFAAEVETAHATPLPPVPPVAPVPTMAPIPTIAPAPAVAPTPAVMIAPAPPTPTAAPAPALPPVPPAPPARAV